MEKLIKKRNVPQKLSPHSKRWDQSEVPRFKKGKGDAGAAGRLNIYMGREMLCTTQGQGMLSLDSIIC